MTTMFRPAAYGEIKDRVYKNDERKSHFPSQHYLFWSYSSEANPGYNNYITFVGTAAKVQRTHLKT